MKCSFFCHCCPQSWQMKSSHPNAKEASSWAIIHLWLWVIGSHFFALQCPGVLLSTSVSLPTHYIQVLDNTWVPCDIQMANFPLFRHFAALTHLREVYVCAIQASESQTERRAVRLSLFSSQKCFMKHLFLFCWFCFCLSSNNSISVAQMIITWCRTPEVYLGSQLLSIGICPHLKFSFYPHTWSQNKP